MKSDGSQRLGRSDRYSARAIVRVGCESDGPRPLGRSDRLGLLTRLPRGPACQRGLGVTVRWAFPRVLLGGEFFGPALSVRFRLVWCARAWCVGLLGPHVSRSWVLLCARVLGLSLPPGPLVSGGLARWCGCVGRCCVCCMGMFNLWARMAVAQILFPLCCMLYTQLWPTCK